MGNPASAAVAVHLLGRPLIGAPEDWWRRGPSPSPSPGIPSAWSWCAAASAAGRWCRPRHQGAHAVTSLTGTDALAMVPPGGVAAGEVVAYSRMA